MRGAANTGRMKRSFLLFLVAPMWACGGSQQGAPNEGAAERAGKKLDEAAHDVKETGDEVGEKVGDSLGRANDAVRDELHLHDGKDAGAPDASRDSG